MGNIELLKKENKTIGAYIRAESGEQIDWYLCMLNKFQKDNGIEKLILTMLREKKNI